MNSLCALLVAVSCGIASESISIRANLVNPSDNGTLRRSLAEDLKNKKDIVSLLKPHGYVHSGVYAIYENTAYGEKTKYLRYKALLQDREGQTMITVDISAPITKDFGFQQKSSGVMHVRTPPRVRSLQDEVVDSFSITSGDVVVVFFNNYNFDDAQDKEDSHVIIHCAERWVNLYGLKLEKPK